MEQDNHTFEKPGYLKKIFSMHLVSRSLWQFLGFHYTSRAIALARFLETVCIQNSTYVFSFLIEDFVNISCGQKIICVKIKPTGL